MILTDGAAVLRKIRGSHIRKVLKDLAEIRGVCKSNGNGDFLNGCRGVKQKLLGFFNSVKLNVVRRGHVEYRQEDVAVVGLAYS